MEDHREILYVIPSLDIGGTEHHLAQITSRLRERGWKSAIYCLFRAGAQAAEVQRSGVQVIAPPFGLALNDAGRAARGVQLLATCAKLLAVMLVRRPRIVHFFLPAAYVIGGPLALLTRIPIRIMSRRNLNRYQAKRPRLRRLGFRLHKHMTALLGNSDSIVRELTELEGCEPQKVRLIYNGVAASGFKKSRNRAKLRRRLKLPDNAFIAIIVANLIGYKGHKNLFRALAPIRDALPKPWMLLCVGRDDGMLTDLEELARESGIAGNVRFLGVRTDVPDLLASAELGILCSHEEGFANAILEGMAAGLPMIVTDVGGNAEAVIDGETGLVVPANNPEALGAAIRQLASNPARAKALGGAGQRRVNEVFTLERCVAEYDLFYRELLQEVQPKSTSSTEEKAHLPSPSRKSCPTVSVIIPVHNRAQLVQKAIHSVFEQTYEDFELIIVDDGSTDDLADALSRIKDPRMRVVSHDENKGAAAARNTGISEARGEYVAFLDSDDSWLPQKLKRQLEFMRSSKQEVRLSCTAYKIFSRYHPEGEFRFAKPLLTDKDMEFGCRLSPGSTLMAEKSLCDKVGPMNEDLLRLEDWDWLIRCSKFSNVAVQKEVLSVVDYRGIEEISYDAVKTSADLMRHLHYTTSGLLPSIARLRFLAALENELAATAHRNRRYRLALWHLLKSLCYMPYRSFDYLWRVGSAILPDGFRFGQSRRT